MILVIGCNKGGASKSTTALNVATYLAIQGKDVCLLDADPQSSCSKWYSYREDAGLQPTITLVQKYGNIAGTLKEMDKKYDYVVVDVAGRNSREFVTSGTVAHHIISPHLASQFDLDTIEELEQQAEGFRDLNPELEIWIYQSKATTNPITAGKERSDFIEFMNGYNFAKMLTSKSCERKIYRDVLPEGKSVLETSNQLARQEIIDLVKEVLGHELP
ncbi:AAA family ATPase [Salmonella enterica subsp. enterica]|uniref:Chromosome partitioning protein ParA n=1 Tax=Salmonella enterica subsp. enterica serovar Aqua TaxID=1302615 RepID=A0A5X6EQU8_SALET|nr:chromosome partitioning protein ParA [Salmonella enterica subsp. enterica serovar Bareilly]ECA3794825.1 chromosome partitioning protein ParA [Salmonella enterica subsp. enterica serovar Aqua]ECH1171996.1 AAA family ATPase [Salmonella enterica subsp. enterica serovar Aqua]HCM8928335.1 AAA family ATPase [Salmonella enterica subsp. enterica serovar Paratyphi B]